MMTSSGNVNMRAPIASVNVNNTTKTMLTIGVDKKNADYTRLITDCQHVNILHTPVYVIRTYEKKAFLVTRVRRKASKGKIINVDNIHTEEGSTYETR